MTPANACIVPSTLESDIRELHKWLNEQPNRPVDRPALARVVYYARMASAKDDGLRPGLPAGSEAT